MQTNTQHLLPPQDVVKAQNERGKLRLQFGGREGIPPSPQFFKTTTSGGDAACATPLSLECAAHSHSIVPGGLLVMS
jgi:hypothetical protein